MNMKHTNVAGQNDHLFWKLCAWAGPLYVVGSLIGWALVAGFVPPPRADWSADQVAQFFTDNSVRIRAGMVLTLLFQPLYVVWSVAIYRIMRTMEGKHGTLSMVQVLASVLNWAIIMIALVLWMTAAFRPEARSPQDIMLLCDLGWMVIDVPIMGTVLQYVALATAFLLDKRVKPLLPSWVCWLTYAVAVLYIADAIIPFFFSGPFSWHGLVSFWVVYSMYFVWMVPVSYYVLKAIDRLKSEGI